MPYLLAAGHFGETLFDEFKISGSGADVSIAKFVMNDHPSLSNMANNRHVSLFAFIGKCGLEFPAYDLAGINIEGKFLGA